ncbi:unnamed protein product [marine sediment metagenome]|uniref:Uncharacterized protein n=1 Tax=marine sediment metagenome TaxID=412755 RepID=X1GVN8_9ZZZZ
MSETCPYCGRSDFANTKALGSHIHYVHENESWASMSQNRSESEKERFQKLFCSCLPDKDLCSPRQLEKIEQAIIEIPGGISPPLDKYRDAFKCAITKEKLLKEVEEELPRESKTEDKK